MSQKNKDLEDLLKPLKDIAPNDLQMQQWQNAVQNELTTNKAASHSNIKWAFQLVAATLIGFIIGVLLFKNNSERESSSQMAQISLEDATFERSHDNLD
ncbi:MAG TPA: hypothetical protein VIG33_12115 [Pseudobdellovibrionaceae bacterium]|jgi:F0F1-type ATP synthase assembly protein I